VEICVSEESQVVIIDSMIVVQMDIVILVDLPVLSQYLVLVQANTGVLVICLVVLLTQLSLEEAEQVIKLDHLVLVGADSVPVDLLK
jgi:hypothetical protein